MNRNKKFASGVNVGSSSILVTFVLLCLITFAALSFVSANSDYLLSKQVADRTTRYYEAAQVADVYVSNIKSQVKKCIETSESEDDFYTKLNNEFLNNQTVNYEKNDDIISFSYSLIITDKQVLDVVLTTSYTKFMETGTLDIKKWQSVPVYTEENSKLEDNNTNLLF